MNDVLQLLIPKHFLRPSHAIVFQAMINLDEKKEPVDPNTLKEELKRLGKLEEIGIEFIIELTSSVSTSANVEFYTRIVLRNISFKKSYKYFFKDCDKCFDPTSNTFSHLTMQSRRFLIFQNHFQKRECFLLEMNLTR